MTAGQMRRRADWTALVGLVCLLFAAGGVLAATLTPDRQVGLDVHTATSEETTP